MSPPTPTPTITKEAPERAPVVTPHVKRPIPWYLIALSLWSLLWLGWVLTQTYGGSRLVRVPEDITSDVSLPTVNEEALAEIRSRDAAGLIVPTQNNAPRANPFQ